MSILEFLNENIEEVFALCILFMVFIAGLFTKYLEHKK